jgi:hypothetical protein
MNNIPTQQSINSIIDSVIANANNAVKIVNAAVNSISAINDKTSQVGLLNKRQVKNVVSGYKEISNIIIETLCDDNENGDKVAIITSRMEEYKKNPNTNIKSKSYSTIDVTMRLLRMMNSSFSVIERLSEFNMGFFTMRRLKKNIRAYATAMYSIITEFSKVFSGFDFNGIMNDAIKCLVADPKTVEKTRTKDADGNISTKTVTTTGRAGLIDVFERTFGILDRLNNLRVPNFIKLKIKLKFVRLTFNVLISELADWAQKNATPERQQQLLAIEQMLVGDGRLQSKKTGSVYSAVRALSNICNAIKGIRLGPLTLVSLYMAFFVLKQFINMFVKIIPQLEKITDKKIITTVGKAKNAISSLSHIFNELGLLSIKIILLAAIAIPAFVSMIVVLLYIGALVLFIKAVKWLTSFIDKVSVTVSKNINKVAKVFVSLLLVGASIILLAMLAPMFIDLITWSIIPFLGVILLFLVGLYFLMKLSARITKKTVSSTAKVVVNLLLILGLLTITMGVLLVVGVLAKLLLDMNAIWNVIIALGLTIILCVVLIGLGALVGLAAPLIAASTAAFLPLLGLLGILLITFVSIIALSIIINKLSNTDSDTLITKINWMTSFIESLTNLGITMITFIPAMIIAAIGFGLLNAFLFDVSLTFLLITKIANTSVTDEIKANVDKSIINIGDIITSISDNLLSDENLDVSKMRKAKRYMRQIKHTVRTIFKIAKTLNKLQNIKLNESVILDNVTSIFSFVTTLDEKISAFMAPEPAKAIDDKNSTDSKNQSKFLELITGVKNDIKTIYNRKLKEEQHADARVRLNKIQKVIKTLNNVGETLMMLQEYKLDTGEKSVILSNVDSIFTFIESLDKHIETFMKPTETVEQIKEFKNDLKHKENANKKLSKIESIISTLGTITSTINDLKDIKIGNVNDPKSLAGKVIDNTKNLFEVIDSVSTTIQTKMNEFDRNNIDFEDISEFSTPILKYISQLNNHFEDIAKVDSASFEKNIGNYGKFIEKVNTIDVEKTGKTAYMFEQMARFSESIRGDFDKLAEILGEKLLPVLEEMKSVIGNNINIPNNLSNVNTQTTTATTPQNINTEQATTSSTKNNVFTDLTDTVKSTSKAQINAVTSVTTKIDELMSLLQGLTGGKVVVKLEN